MGFCGTTQRGSTLHSGRLHAAASKCILGFFLVAETQPAVQLAVTFGFFFSEKKSTGKGICKRAGLARRVQEQHRYSDYSLPGTSVSLCKRSNSCNESDAIGSCYIMSTERLCARVPTRRKKIHLKRVLISKQKRTRERKCQS